MAVMDSNGDQDSIARIWGLLNELCDQLSQNRTNSIGLHTVAGNVKSQAVHSQTGFVLRRYNLDKPQEIYDAELERMTATMSAENQTLQNDNKQLNALIKEYEQTLENLMTTFRTRANEVQQRELSIMREYEHKLLLRETEELLRSLTSSTNFSSSLGRLGDNLRTLMRILSGEDADALPSPSELSHIMSVPALDPREGAFDTEKDKQLAAAEWALERECELARLELENEHLRRLVAEHLGVNSGAMGAQGQAQGERKVAELPRLTGIPRVPAREHQERLGGKEVGPYGMYKKFDESGR